MGNKKIKVTIDEEFIDNLPPEKYKEMKEELSKLLENALKEAQEDYLRKKRKTYGELTYYERDLLNLAINQRKKVREIHKALWSLLCRNMRKKLKRINNKETNE